MGNKPQFGQKKTVNGKEYTYKQDARGGNYGSWFLTGSDNMASHTDARSMKDDFYQDVSSKEREEQAIEDMYDIVDDMDMIYQANIGSSSGSSFNMFQKSYRRRITQMDNRAWTDDNYNDLQVLQNMMKHINNPHLTDKKRKQLVDKEFSNLSDYKKPRRNSFGGDTMYEKGEVIQEISKSVKAYADMAQYRRAPQELEKLKNQQIHNMNSGLILTEGELGAAAKNSYMYYDIAHSPYFASGVNAYMNNGDLPIEPESTESNFVDQAYAAQLSIQGNQQLQLMTVFPNRELKDAMEKYNVNNVEVRSFENTREVGNVYTVMQPNGNTMSFSVYEHRNADSIIINGKENWNPDVEDDLPYAGGKYDYFAEVSHGEYEKAAEFLTFFLKEAQNGTLDDIDTLVQNSPRIDQNTILAEQLGESYMQFLEKYAPGEGARVRKNIDGNKSDEEILRDLDF